jgi:ABC-type Fe3+ transport system substrate-binding protein
LAEADAALSVIGVTDQASIADVIWPAFQRDVLRAGQLEYTQDVVSTRVLAQVRDLPVGSRPDVILTLDPQGFVDTGLSEVSESWAASRYPAAWAAGNGMFWPLYMEPFVAIYNAHFANPPAAWQDLAAAAWGGRTVLEEPARMQTAGPALAELSSALDPETWNALITGLAATRPSFVPDNERAVLEVASGGRWLGLSNLRFARRIRAGSPVRHVFLDPSPCIPTFGLLVRGGRNRELGRQFLAWLTSEAGQRAFEVAGRVACLPDLAAPAFARLAGGRVRPLFGSVGWVTDRSSWADRFRTMFAANEPSQEGVAARVV